MSSAKNRSVLYLLTMIVVIALLVGLFYLSKQGGQNTTLVGQPMPAVDGIMLNTPRKIDDFTLTADNGKPFTLKNLKGHWSFMFFGFTHCPHVCPTTMAALSKMYKTLSKTMPKQQLPQVVMVSVDPERDSVSRMGAYVKAFNPHFIGVRGDFRQLKPLEHELHVVAHKEPSTDGVKSHYNMAHTASIMVIGPDATLRGYLSYPHKAKVLVRDYRNIVRVAGVA